MKSKILPLLMLILLSFTIVNGADYDYGWKFQSVGLQSYPFSDYLYTGSSFEYAGLGGQDSYPIMCDIDGDVIKEVINYNEGELYIFDGQGNNVDNITTVDLSPLANIMDVACLKRSKNSAFNDNKLLILYNASGNIYLEAFTFDGSSLTEIEEYFSAKPSSTHYPVSRLTCAISTNTEVCAYASVGHTMNYYTNTYTSITENFVDAYFQPTNDKVLFIDNLDTLEFSTNIDFIRSPVLDSVTGLRTMGMVLNNGTYDTPVLIDIDSCQTQWGLSSTCDINVSYINSTEYNHVQELSVNNDICFVVERQLSGVAQTILSCVDSFTQVGQNYTISSLGGAGSGNSVVGQAVAYDVNNDGFQDVCVDSNTVVGATGGGKMNCFDIENNVELNNLDLSGGSPRYQFLTGYTDGTNQFIVANFQGDMKLVIPNSSTFSIYDFFTTKEYIYFFNDISGDGFGEFVGIINGDTTVVFTQEQLPDSVTTFNSSGPIVGGTLGVSGIYQGLYGFYQNICNNTIMTIRAKECVGTLTCNYVNNNPNPYVRERICTDCGGREAYHCGNWSSATPTVTCSNLSQTGILVFNVTMNTETNPNITTHVFEDVQVRIVTGVSGESCNIDDELVVQFPVGGDEIDPEPEPEPEDNTIQGNAIARFFDLVLGQNVFLKGIFGCFIVLMFVIIPASFGLKEGFILTVCGVVGIVCATFMGLFPVIAMVFLCLLMIFVFLIYISVINR